MTIDLPRPIASTSRPAPKQPKQSASAARLPPTNARDCSTWKAVCMSVGVMRITTTIAAVSTQVTTIDSNTAGR